MKDWIHTPEGRSLLAVSLLAIIVCFFGITSMPLVDPDDVFYAGVAKEMIIHHSPLIPILFGQANFEKPPLFFWMLIFSFKIFGVTTFAARFVCSRDRFR